MLDLVMPGRLENLQTPPSPLGSVDSLGLCGGKKNSVRSQIFSGYLAILGTCSTVLRPRSKKTEEAGGIVFISF